MSRTRKGKKGAGYDYWGRRAYSGDCGYGPDVKKLTHKHERRVGAKKAIKESQNGS